MGAMMSMKLHRAHGALLRDHRGGVKFFFSPAQQAW